MQKTMKTCHHHENTNSSAFTVYDHPDITHVVEFIQNKLYFATLVYGRKIARSAENIIFFNTDNELIYIPINNDFGPLNLGCIYRFCNLVSKKLKNVKNRHKQIVYYTCEDENKRANAAFLIGCFAVLYLKETPVEVVNALNVKDAPIFKPFLDAAPNTFNLKLSLLDCLNGIKKARKYGFFKFEDFNLIEYEKYSEMRNGDLNWIVPQKFIAFVGPSTEKGTNYHPPEKYINYFHKAGVQAVIRLNRKCYDAVRFTKMGIQHYDLYMQDGSIPNRQILRQFLHICENTNGTIAVHCKAGLGRTGTLIAAYIIKHYKIRAKEAIAWVRICRPGSVIAPQQQWLEEMETSLQRAGQIYRLVCHQETDSINRHKHGIYSIIYKSIKNIDPFIPKENYAFEHPVNFSEMLRVRRKVKQLKKDICEAEN